MRRFALVAAGLGVAASMFSVSPASAVCVNAWQQVTGQCSPCNTVGGVFNRVEDLTGVKPDVQCLA